MSLHDEKELTLINEKAKSYIAHESDPHFRQEVLTSFEENAQDDLYDRFYTSLSFGTAGMRGVIGGGTNRINPFMIRKVTQGLANYLLTQEAEPSVVIAFDSRNYSKLFAEKAAITLCANGVVVYLYDTLRPVPLLSFAVQYLKATSGIVITASHNPAKYNGYKVYYSDGGQVTPPHDVGIAKMVKEVDISDIKNMSSSEAREKNLLRSVPNRVDDAYDELAISSLLRKDIIASEMVSVAYTPLHGSGDIPVRRILGKLGLTVHTVEAQQEANGDFPTVSMPNPEDPEAMRLVIELAKKVGADIVLGTDPDADRLGIAIPSNKQKTEYTLLSGNQIAVLLTDYLIERNNELSPTKKKPLVVKSFVTTDLVRAITEKNKGRCVDVLTGFKYIAEEIVKVEHSDKEFYLFGCEESFGYNSLKGIRDKDAVSSALLAVEMMSYYSHKGITLQQRLESIYNEYGFYTENVMSFAYEGASGLQKMDQIMQSFRDKKVGDEFAEAKIVDIVDLLNDKNSGFPPSDVIIIKFDNSDKMVIRPSGTEPKIKYYFFFKTEASQKDEYLSNLSERVAAYKAYL